MHHMNQFCTLLLIALFPVCSVYAQQRSQSDAEARARSFLASRSTIRNEITLNPVKGNLLGIELGLRRSKAHSSTSAFFTDLDNQPFYVFNQSGGGFVIVAGDQRMSPILGYSDQGSFDITQIPDGLCELLDEYAELYERVRCQTVASSRASSERDNISPFITSRWTQYSPYYNQCPLSGSSRTIAGCGAIAMAQAMRYYSYPARGQGSFSYTSKTLSKSLSSDFSAHTYDWDNILDQYRSGYTSAQAAAVSQFIFDVGVSLAMDYGVSWSNSYINDIPYALINNFGYNPNVVAYIASYHPKDEWADIIYSELEALRPIVYRGANANDDNGHIFLLDGYADGAYHVNWGWGGNCDGWFELYELFPDRGCDYRYYHWMVCNISPDLVGTHEDVFYAKNFYADAETYDLTETAVLHMDNVYNYSSSTAPRDANITLSGQLGIGLYDAQDNFIRVASSFGFSDLQCWWGWSSTWFNVRFSSLGIDEGHINTLRPIIINAKGEITPIRTIGGICDRIYLYVKDGCVSLSSAVPVGITSLQADTQKKPIRHEGTYTMDGRRVPSGPAPTGIYINNGRKVFIRR